MSKYHTLHQIEKVTELVNELTQIPATSTSDPDEIRQIRSTGQAIAQCLSSLGSRLAQLADHSFEGRAEILKSTEYLGQRPPVRPMSANHYTTEDKREEVAYINVSRPEMMADRLLNQPRQQKKEPDRRQPGQSNWRELADFFVSFGFSANQDGEEGLCTRVYHSQLDQSAQWPGIALDQLLNWLLQQAGLSLPARLEAQTASSQSTTQGNVPLSSTPQATLGLKALLPTTRKPETDDVKDETRFRTSNASVQPQLSHSLSPLSLPHLSIEPTTYPANNSSNPQFIQLPIHPIPNSSNPQTIQSFNQPPLHPSYSFLLILYTLAKLLPPKPKIRGSGFG